VVVADEGLGELAAVLADAEAVHPVVHRKPLGRLPAHMRVPGGLGFTGGRVYKSSTDAN
jgi:hypothetical protein